MLKAYWKLFKFRNSYFQEKPFKWLRHTMIKQKQGNVMSVALIGVHKNFAIQCSWWLPLKLKLLDLVWLRNWNGGIMAPWPPHWLHPCIYHCNYVNRIRILKKLLNFIFLWVHNPRVLATICFVSNYNFLLPKRMVAKLF